MSYMKAVLPSRSCSITPPSFSTACVFRARRALPSVPRELFISSLRTASREASTHPVVRSAAARRNYSASSTRSAIPTISYGISAAYSAKGERLDPVRNLFHLGSSTPSDQGAADNLNGRSGRRQRPRSGQDAFFACRVEDTGEVAFGVADGVGGWMNQGIDPANYSHSLCEYMAQSAKTYDAQSAGRPLKPQELLRQGFFKVARDSDVEGGGSTACVAVADRRGRLEVANLGDSGFIHLRLNAVRHRSPVQTHDFNAPFQLSKIPRVTQMQMALFGRMHQYAELPKDAAITDHQVRHGDVLIFATDGVWDNLSPQDALQLVGRHMITHGGWTDAEDGLNVGSKLWDLTHNGGVGIAEKNTLQGLLAQAIVAEAKEASMNTKRDGPFAKEVQRHFPSEKWRGGKMDDICAVVAIAVADSAGSP